MKTYLYPLLAGLLSLAACTNDTLQEIAPVAPGENTPAANTGKGTFFVDYSVDGGASTRADNPLKVQTLDYYVYYAEGGELVKHRRIRINPNQSFPLTREDMTWEQRQALQDTLQYDVKYRTLFIANVDSTLFNYGTYGDTNPHPAVVTGDTLYQNARILLPNVPFHEDNYYCLWEDTLHQLSTAPLNGPMKRNDVLLQRIVTRTDIKRVETPTTLYDAIANSVYAEDGEWYGHIKEEVDQKINAFITYITKCVGYNLSHTSGNMKIFEKNDKAVEKLTELLSNNKKAIYDYIKDKFVQAYVEDIEELYTPRVIDWANITSAQINYDASQRANAIGFDLTGHHDSALSNTALGQITDEHSIRFFGFQGTALNSFSSITLNNTTTISGTSFNTNQSINTHCGLICDPVKSVTLEENISTTSGEDFYDLTEAMKDVNGWDDFTKMDAVDSDEDIITVINYFFGCGLWGLGHINDELEDHSLQEFPFSITRPIITTDNTVALIWELVNENNP